jgi:hypothetical protein
MITNQKATSTNHSSLAATIEQRPVEQLVPAGAKLLSKGGKVLDVPRMKVIAQDRKHPHSRQVCLERRGSADRSHSSAAIIVPVFPTLRRPSSAEGGKKDMNDIFERRDGEIVRETGTPWSRAW